MGTYKMHALNSTNVIHVSFLEKSDAVLKTFLCFYTPLPGPPSLPSVAFFREDHG